MAPPAIGCTSSSPLVEDDAKLNSSRESELDKVPPQTTSRPKLTNCSYTPRMRCEQTAHSYRSATRCNPRRNLTANDRLAAERLEDAPSAYDDSQYQL